MLELIIVLVDSFPNFLFFLTLFSRFTLMRLYLSVLVTGVI